MTVHTQFEDTKCGTYPMHSSNNECNSMENGDNSDDDEIEEL